MFPFALGSHCRSSGDTEASNVCPRQTHICARSKACPKHITLLWASGERKANLAAFQQGNIRANPRTAERTSRQGAVLRVGRACGWGWGRIGLCQRAHQGSRSKHSSASEGIHHPNFDANLNLIASPLSTLSQIKFPCARLKRGSQLAELGPISNCNIIGNKISKEK